MKVTHILALGVFLFVIVYMMKDQGNEVMYPVESSYVAKHKDMGFVKPEHKLVKVFSSMSSGPKIQLGGVCEETIYDKNTIPAILNEKVVALVRKLIGGIQQIMKQEYFIKKIENLYILQDTRGNTRYIIDFFVYDVNHYYTMRLLSDIVILDGVIYLNYLNMQSASAPTLLNKYDIKFDSEGILFGYNMFHENMMMLFDNYYLKNFKVIGVSDSNLEYNKEDLSEVMNLDSFLNGYFPSNLSKQTVKNLEVKGLDGYLDMYLPSNQSTIKDPLFCKKYKLQWDEYGIPIPQEVPPTCLRNNNATIAKLNDPWFGPGVMYERSSNDKYRWLKDRGNISNTL